MEFFLQAHLDIEKSFNNDDVEFIWKVVEIASEDMDVYLEEVNKEDAQLSNSDSESSSST
jgi:hypothetical protein